MTQHAAHDPKIQALTQQAMQALQQGKKNQAQNSLKKVLKLAPNHPEANHFMGVIAHQTGNHARAEQLIRKAIKHSPEYIAAYNNLAVVLRAMDKQAEAVSILGEIIARKPDYADAHCNLGVLYAHLGRHDEARLSLQTCIDLAPTHSDALMALGQLCRSTANLTEAIQRFQEVLRIKPTHPDALFNIGLTLCDAGNLIDAIEIFSELLKSHPGHAPALNRRGLCFQKKGKLTLARKDFEAALQCDNSSNEFRHNLYWNMAHCRMPDQAIEGFQQTQNKRMTTGTLSSLCMLSNYSDRMAPEASLKLHQQYAALCKESTQSKVCRPTPDGKIRIGYVSGDLNYHSVAYFLLPLLENHDHSKFEIHCFYNGFQQDEYTERFKSVADHWHEIGHQSDPELLELIEAEGIDILIDLSGHTNRNRLEVFAQRAAPIQIAWLGYPNTTGLNNMDYRIVDTKTDPAPEAAPLCTEQLLYLPRHFLCYQPQKRAPAITLTDKDSGAKVTFGSFNNLVKLTDSVIETWSAILRTVPNSTLILKSTQLEDEAVADALLQAFASHDIDPARIETLARIEQASEHLDLYNRIDIALDTFPYNGTTTTLEALWMGVPTITLRGDRHASRVGYSILSALSLEQLVAENQQQYVEKATLLAQNPESLAEFKTTLRDRLTASSLCDGKQFAGDFENLLNACYRKKVKNA